MHTVVSSTLSPFPAEHLDFGGEADCIYSVDLKVPAVKIRRAITQKNVKIQVPMTSASP